MLVRDFYTFSLISHLHIKRIKMTRLLYTFRTAIIPFFLVSLFSGLQELIAQQEIYFDHLDVPQGLSSSNVRSICQDRYGFLWLATDDGLNRYDGYRFEVFKNDPDDSTSLPDSRVEWVIEDSEGIIWIATQGGLSRWDSDRRHFINYQPAIASPFSNDQWIIRIYEDSADQLWLGTRFGGLYLFDKKNETFEPAKLLYTEGVTRVFGGPVAGFIKTAAGEFFSASYNDGILRFDEAEGVFKTVKYKGINPKMFFQNAVFEYHEDKTGSIWIAAQGGLYRMDPERIFVEEIRLPKNTMPNFTVTTFTETDAGYLWIGSSEGLYVYNLRTNEIEHLTAHNDDPNALSENQIWCSYEDQFGVLWFGTIGGGLNKFDPQKIVFKSNKEIISETRTTPTGIYAITGFIGEKNKFWISTDDGVYLFDRENNEYDLLDAIDVNKTGIIRQLVTDQKNNLWLGSQRQSLFKFNTRSGDIHHYPSNTQNLSGPNSNSIFSLEFDDYGNLWIGTADGLNRLNPKTNAMSRIPSLESRNYQHEIHAFIDSLFNKNKLIARIKEPPDYANLEKEFTIDQQSYLLIVSVGEGLFNWNMVDFGWLQNSQGDTLWDMTDLSTTFHLNGSIKNRVEAKIIQLSPGSYKLRYESDDSHTYGLWNETPPADSAWWGISAFEISAEAAERYNKLIQADLEKPYIKGLDTRALEYSSKGYLWIGTDLGFSKYEIKSRRITNYISQHGVSSTLSDNIIIYLLEDKEGILWIATPKGLNRFDPETETFRVYTEKDGLPSDQLRALAEDDAGNLWISTVNGLSKFEKNRSLEQPVFVNYDVQDGLQGYQFYYRSVYTNPGGELFFGGKNGFNAFSTGKVNSALPKVVISDMFISNQITTVQTENSPLSQSIYETDRITLDYYQNDLSFEFATLHFSRPEKNQVAYRLDGYQSEWVSNERRFASFTNLDPGEYRFRVRGISSDGVLAANEKILQISINKPWWNTTLAYVFYGLFFVLGVFIVDRIQRYRLTQREHNRMLIREAELRAAAAESENERKTQELEDARNLQLSLLPKHLPQLPNLEIAVYMKTATEVGGDYYDFHVTADGNLNIVFGDAAGHGMRAGTVVTLMKGLFSADGGNINIDHFLNRSSDTIKELHYGRVMMALTLLKINGNKVRFSSAGMPPAYIYRKQSQRIEEICMESVPLGAMKASDYKIVEDQLLAGDTMLLLSDGLPELKDPTGLIFDYPRVENSFREVADKSAQQIIDYLAETGENWRQNIAQEDDITFMVIKAK